MYPRLRPPQRGQTKPLGQRCAVRWAAEWASSPKRARNWLTVRMGFRFRLECFISDIISPFVRLTKLDIHLLLFGRRRDNGRNHLFHECAPHGLLWSSKDLLIDRWEKRGGHQQVSRHAPQGPPPAAPCRSSLPAQKN